MIDIQLSKLMNDVPVGYLTDQLWITKGGAVVPVELNEFADYELTDNPNKETKSLTYEDYERLTRDYFASVPKIDERQLQPFAKHLQGKHDQSTHGRGHSTERPYELKPAKPDPREWRSGAWIEDVEQGKGPSAYRLSNYGTTGIEGWNPITEYGGKSKARSEYILAKRASEETGTNKDFMIDIANDPDYPKIPKKVLETALKDASWNQNGTMTLESLDADRMNDLSREAFGQWAKSDPQAAAAYLAKENKFVSDRIREVKFANGQTVGEVVDGMSNSMLEQMQAIATDNGVSLTLDASKLEKFIAEDHYRTAYETKLSGKGAGRETYMARREDFENNKMGVPAMIPDSERPIYGVIGKQGMTYGDTQVIFKDDVKHRTTATIGDSLDGQLRGAHWLEDYGNGKVTIDDLWDSHGTLLVNTLGNNNRSGSTFIWDKPDESGDVPWGSIKGFSGKTDLPAIATYGYIETQIHGGVSLKDVATIVIPSSNAISKKALATLAEQGIEVIVGSHIEKSEHA